MLRDRHPTQWAFRQSGGNKVWRLSKNGIHGHSPKSVVIARFQVAQVTCATRVVGFRGQSCRHSCHRHYIEWALSLGTTNVVDYHQEDLFDTLANNSVDVVLRRCGLCLEKPLDKLGCCLSADTRPHGVDHGSTRGSDHSRWD